MMKPGIFPQQDWALLPASEFQMNSRKLDQAKKWLEEKFQDLTYRVAIVRHGYLVAEWTHNIEADRKVHIASANKSLLSSMLGIAIAEGKIKAALSNRRCVDHVR